ncbi:MAG: Kae1-associated serine/threonine protein kinase [Candidatus Aenigmarchaeota archaeon]|nr:Kae1-associated serine/threonine protein kinase [Candidatus Aenigmarchaeota archaeon]
MLIAKGAEAELRREGDTLVKERIAKGYRLREIDEKLRKRRTALEARLLREARRAGINTPRVIEEGKTSLILEFIEGGKVKDILKNDNSTEIAGKIGQAIAKLHGFDIIHGDLTTSNMILKDSELFLIDFGLGFISKRTEDKAVDLYLLHEALESTHFELLEETWTSVLEAYKSNYADSGKVIKALSDVEKRGRYKERPAKKERSK